MCFACFPFVCFFHVFQVHQHHLKLEHIPCTISKSPPPKKNMPIVLCLPIKLQKPTLHILCPTHLSLGSRKRAFFSPELHGAGIGRPGNFIADSTSFQKRRYRQVAGIGNASGPRHDFQGLGRLESSRFNKSAGVLAKRDVGTTYIKALRQTGSCRKVLWARGVTRILINQLF